MHLRKPLDTEGLRIKTLFSEKHRTFELRIGIQQFADKGAFAVCSKLVLFKIFLVMQFRFALVRRSLVCISLVCVSLALVHAVSPAVRRTEKETLLSFKDDQQRNENKFTVKTLICINRICLQGEEEERGDALDALAQNGPKEIGRIEMRIEERFIGTHQQALML